MTTETSCLNTFFEKIYKTSKFNDFYKNYHLAELTVQKLVNVIEKDTEGCEDTGPENWINIDTFKNMYQKFHSELVDTGDKIYRKEFYGKKSSNNDKLIWPIDFLIQVFEKLRADGIGLKAIQRALIKWFGIDGLNEIDSSVIKQAIEEVKINNSLENF